MLHIEARSLACISFCLFGLAFTVLTIGIAHPGRCVKLRVDVWPDYMSQTTPAHISDAHDKFAAGEYDSCDALELKAMHYQVAGN